MEGGGGDPGARRGGGVRITNEGPEFIYSNIEAKDY